jgi:MYXO-CTERM domain-containing protein
MNARYSKIVGLVLGVGALWAAEVPSTARAHISLERAGTHKSRYGDANIKEGVCGLKNETARGKNVYTYEPGETITIKVTETIPHPGYFRIAFDDDGVDDFKDPVSIKPLDPRRKCPFDRWDRCDKSDFYNTKAVLPGMDNLFPHVTAGFGTLYEFKVKLPEVECTNCTIQIIQVMEDTVHGAYNTTDADGSLEDVYHTCIDVVLKSKGGAKPDAGVKADAGVRADAGVTGGVDAARPTGIGGGGEAEVDEADDESDALAAGGNREASEGCSLSGSQGGFSAAAWLLVGLGALVARQRRRRQQ